MNASKHPLVSTLVFSATQQLVSFSGHDTAHLYQGQTVKEIFPESNLDHVFGSQENAPSLGTVQYGNPSMSYDFQSHSLKNPEGQTLAIIITLIPASTDAHVMNERLVRMDRLVQIGQLASGIAHEIRNPLAGMSANLQVLQSRLGNDPKNKEFTAIVLEEITRIEKIIRDLLNFSRQSKPVLEPLLLEDLFVKIHTMVAAKLSKSSIRLKIECAPDMPPVFADPGQLIQVLLNLIMNAADAEPRDGQILLRSRSHPLDPSRIQIQVIDQGQGMPEETRERIFEPFYTTRAKGLGLGLSVARQIVCDHRGELFIESTPGQGTTMSVLFPIQQEAAIVN